MVQRERERIVDRMQQPKHIALIYFVGHKQKKSLIKTQIFQHYFIIIDIVPKLCSLTFARSEKNNSLSAQY